MTKKEMRVALDAMILEQECFLERLRELRAEMRNRPATTRGRATSVTVTPEVKARIHELRRKFPDLPQHELGKMVGTQQGRISETLSGIRT